MPGEDHGTTLTYMDDVVVLLGGCGETWRAVALLRESFERQQRVLSTGHSRTLILVACLAVKGLVAGLRYYFMF